jgi:hypothetical protein
MKKIPVLLFVICCLVLVAFSYGFVDYNFPLTIFRPYQHFFFKHRFLATLTFVTIVVVLFGLYFYCLQRAAKNQLTGQQTWRLIGLVVTLLFFAWPAFSYDIFNYIATARVTYFYKENPYLVMPIEFQGEPMLKFMHAANKTALYGPTWILMTFIPHTLGQQNLLLTIYTFKLFIILFYLLVSWLVWRLSRRSVRSLTFFALNPLVIIETLVSAHNDVVMMSLVMISLYWFFQRRRILSWLALLFSTGIKFATVVLWPLWLFAGRLSRERFISLAAWLLFAVFLLSPLREEMYPWYFIWIIALAALVPKSKMLYWLTLSFSFGLLLRYTPWFATRRWDGITPVIKQIVTFTPPVIVFVFNKLKRKI